MTSLYLIFQICRSINFCSPHFKVDNINNSFILNYLQNFKFKNFYGCLANLSVMIQGAPLGEIWEPVDWQKVDQSKGNTPIWMGCNTNQQSGIRFLGTG